MGLITEGQVDFFDYSVDFYGFDYLQLSSECSESVPVLIWLISVCVVFVCVNVNTHAGCL